MRVYPTDIAPIPRQRRRTAKISLSRVEPMTADELEAIKRAIEADRKIAMAYYGNRRKERKLSNKLDRILAELDREAYA